MDLTEKLMKIEDITDIPVYQDFCTDEKAEKYITYIYQDERPVLCGNNSVLADKCDIYVNLYTPPEFDYFAIKDKIRGYLEENEFVITSITSRVENYKPAKRIRRTTFDCTIAGFR